MTIKITRTPALAALEHKAEAVRQQMELNTPRDFGWSELVEERQFAAVRDRADEAFQALGYPPGPPQPGMNESLGDYRVRLAENLAKKADLGNVNFAQIRSAPPETVTATEAAIYKAALAKADESPVLHQVTLRDARGRERFEFHGKMSSWLNAHKGPVLASPIYIDGNPQYF